MPLLVHDQRAAFERSLGRTLLAIDHSGSGLLGGGGAAQHGLDALDQQALGKGLGDEVVGAHLEPEQLIDLFVLGGEKDHRDVRFLPQAAQQFHAVHARHLDVENGEVGTFRCQTVKS